MNRKAFSPLLITLSLWSGLASCSSETGEVDPYENWEARNVAFIDSIAKVAANPAPGERWEKHLNYKIKSENLTDDLSLSNSDYVYLKILKEGLPDGISPMATDTAVVAYKGLLINKTVFDGSYDNNFMDDFTQATYRTALSAVINGWTTALLHMREGERVELYIPANLGYGTTAKETIPANSTLCFELYLDKVVHPKGPDDRSLTEVMEEE